MAFYAIVFSLFVVMWVEILNYSRNLDLFVLPKGVKNAYRIIKKELVIFVDYCQSAEEDIDEIMNNLGKQLSPKEIIDIKYNDINIGADIWQSIQRFLFMGYKSEIGLIPGSIAYNFIKSAYLYAYSFDNFFSENYYDYLLLNEISYIDWGIPAKIALEKYDIPIIRLCHHNREFKTFSVNLHKNIRSFGYIPSMIPKEKFNSIITKNCNVFEGKSISRNLLDSSKSLDEKLSMGIFDERKLNVVLFTHLCWDSSIAYGEQIFDTFEDWILETYAIAKRKKNINWIFRVHPHEKGKFLNKKYNTLNFLRDNIDINNYDNIKIMDHTMDSTAADLAQYIDVGITTVGTVSFELPCMGIPVILASRKGYAEYEFTINAEDLDDYTNILNHIEDYCEISNEKVIQAQRYYELLQNELIKNDISTFKNGSKKNFNYFDRIKLNKYLQSKDIYYNIES